MSVSWGRGKWRGFFLRRCPVTSTVVTDDSLTIVVLILHIGNLFLLILLLARLLPQLSALAHRLHLPTYPLLLLFAHSACPQPPFLALVTSLRPAQKPITHQIICGAASAARAGEVVV